MHEHRSLVPVGVLLIILGILSMIAPAVTGTTVVYIIGLILLVSGIVQIAHGAKKHAWQKKAVPFMLGSITGLCGVLVMGHPLLGLQFLTLVMLVFFITAGIWKMVISFDFRPASGWIAMFLGGFLSLLLGFLIWKQWPASGIWAVGLYVGVDLLFTGITMIVIAVTLKRVSTI